MTSSNLELRPDRIGPYKILDVLGEGGMGTVYLAEQRKPVRRRVALKVIKLGMDSKAVLHRFDAERQALAMMEHGSIARVHDCGTTESGQPYFAMEYVKGEPITKYCDDNKLGIQDRLDLFVQICSGVQHAHNKGVIHRDLTPNNVLVTVQDGKAQVKIIDFGLARATDHRLVEATIFTERGQIIGTPEYMSPEQAGLNALDIDAHTDIYTLGVLLYELLVGELPFSREALRKAGLQEMQRIIREEDPPKPSTRLTTAGDRSTKLALQRRMDVRSLTRNLKGDLDWIVMRAMEKDRTRRYETPSELAGDIRRHLQHEPVLASPPGMGYRLRKFTRRYRIQVAAGMVVVLVLVAGIITSWMFYLQAQEEYVRAEAEAQEKERQRGIAVTNAERAIREAEEARRQRTRAQEQERIAKAHLTRFNRLAVAVRLEEAEKEQKALFPAWPEKITALEGWLENHGSPLKAELPQIQETLRQLEALAIPQTAAEKQKDRENHARYNEYLAQQKKVTALQRMMDLRKGTVKAGPVAVPADAPKDARALYENAWLLVDPDCRADVYGQEALGLALAHRLSALVPADNVNRCKCLNVLAWALFANGRFDEAKAESKKAWQAAPDKQKSEYQGFREKLATAIADAGETLSKARDDLSNLEGEVHRRQTFRFADKADGFLHTTLRRVEKDLVAFLGEKGALADVEDRLSWAKRIEALTLRHPKARVTWEQARQAILKADGAEASKLYADPPIELSPQLGLVPVGMNPVTKLWEFYHLRSAWDPGSEKDPSAIEIPEHKEDGTIKVGEGTGIVFVLIPGGTFTMGAQKSDPEGPNHDPQAEPKETSHKVTLSPYFLARHELTQGQWLRLSGMANPSRYSPPHSVDLRHPVEQVSWDLRHPVGQVSWFMGRDLVEWHGLALPTEAQWERGCRAGTETPWFAGPSAEDLEGFANILDRTGKAAAPGWYGDPVPFEDGHVTHAPVGRYKPNGFGLHDVHGNLWEWCRDRYGRYSVSVAPGDGERRITGDSSSIRVFRGGSYYSAARHARSSVRDFNAPTYQLSDLGLRLARGITR